VYLQLAATRFGFLEPFSGCTLDGGVITLQKKDSAP
jgi:hypothetical protein